MRAALAACIVLLLNTHGAAAQPAAHPDAASHVSKAVRLMQDRQYSEAATEFEQALAMDPNNDVVRIQYATCLFAAERNDEARKQFEAERQRLGDKPGLNYYLGQLDLRANDFTAAVKKLAPLESIPGLSKVSLYLGLAYQALGQQARALECLERAAKTDSRDPEVHYRLGRSYSMAGRTEDANREYKLYRDLRETQRLAEQEGRDCMDALRTQPVAQARIVCQRIADPNDSRLLTLLGQLYVQNGAFSDAIDPLRQAVKLDPKSFDAWQNLGFSLFQLKRYQEALPPLRKAASLNPQFFDTLTVIAATLHALGEDAAALPIVERIHQLNPEDAHWASVLEQLRASLRGK